MAQGPNISGLPVPYGQQSWFNFIGPFKSSTNNYYIFAKDGTTATTLRAWKAAGDPLSTPLSAGATLTGFTTAILYTAAYQVSDVIHLLIMHGTAGSSLNYSYTQYNMATDTFLTAESVATAINTSQSINNQCDLCVLSSGN